MVLQKKKAGLAKFSLDGYSEDSRGEGLDVSELN